jgi:hypothetical protein
MSSAYVAVNNGYSTLAAGITTSSQTTITLAAGEGARFPSPTGGDYTLVTVENAARVVEIISVVGRSTDTLTVGIAGSAAANSAGRGMEGTTATTWLTGDVVECRATAAIITIGANASASAAVWSIKTTTYTAVTGNYLMANTTSAAFTITLPATPSANHVVNIADYAGTFATNNLTIGRNSSKIMSLSEDMVISTNNISITLTYIDSTVGWKLT